jgi:hypothetical protein
LSQERREVTKIGRQAAINMRKIRLFGPGTAPG